MAGVALRGIDRHFAWQARHLRHWAGSGGALWAAWVPCVGGPLLRGRRGTSWHGPSLSALTPLGWLWWRAWAAWVPCVGGPLLRGSRGTSWHRPSLCVAGVTLRGIHRHFVWQDLFCVAGVALRGMDLHFLHLRHWAGSGGALGRLGFQWSLHVSCVPGVALRDIHLHFVWQAWHFVASTVTLRGRRGTYGTGLALVARFGRLGFQWSPHVFCVAGVALRDIHLHFVWQAWHFVASTFTLCGKRGTS